jgi:hypothetical protein
MTVPVRQRSQKITSATFTGTGGRSVIQRITSLQPLRLANGPVRPKSALWRRPQCPGTRYALARVSEFPLAIHPRELPVCHRRHRNHQLASFENATFSLNPLWSGMLRAATEKPYPLVQKLCRMKLPCGSLRKTAEESRERNSRPFLTVNDLDVLQRKQRRASHSIHSAGNSSAQP